MDISSIANLFKTLSSGQGTDEKETNVSDEISMQYPYGDFPIRYTKSGQEALRRQSETRFLNPPTQTNTQNSDLDISTIVTLLSLFGGKKKSSSDILELLSPILFKNNPELKTLLKLFNKESPKEIVNTEDFPNTHKVSISSLKRVE